MSYHYGQTIREYRELRNMSLAKLAEKWPSKEKTGATPRYVSDVERGIKHISDLQVLRELASILDIPLWKLGLSEFDPFQEELNEKKAPFDGDVAEELIQDLWLVRQTIPFALFEKKVYKLSRMFKAQLENYPLLRDHKNFSRLYAHERRLEEVVFTEKHLYQHSLACAYDMLKLANLSGDSVAQALAHTRIGVELLRDENKLALEYLQVACDMSLALSKEIRCYCFSMLARGHAQFGDVPAFEKAVDIAHNCGESISGQTVACKDYIFHAYSAVLEEKSNGYILLEESHKVLPLLAEIEREIRREHNTYLAIWIPLDYAQVYMLQGEIEESIKYLRMFYDNVQDYKSVRLLSRVTDQLDALDTRGYEKLRCVKDFRENVMVL